MQFAVDCDGTITNAPTAFASFMEALRGDGIVVTVLTGNKTCTPDFLESMGVPSKAYDRIVVLPDTTLPIEKAAWCVANEVLVIIDNKGDNCLSCVAAGVPLALRPVTTKTVRSRQQALLKRSHRLLDE